MSEKIRTVLKSKTYNRQINSCESQYKISRSPTTIVPTSSTTILSYARNQNKMGIWLNKERLFNGLETGIKLVVINHFLRVKSPRLGRLSRSKSSS